MVALLLVQWHVSAQTWESLGTPPTNSIVNSVNDTLFAATALNLFFSADEGIHWTPILTISNAPFTSTNYIRPDAYLDNQEEFKSVESLVLPDLLLFLVTFETNGSTLQIQRLYRSDDRGQSLEMVYQTAIGMQGGFQLQLPQKLNNDSFLMRSEGFANFVGPVTDYLISIDEGRTWHSNTYAEFQQGAMRTPPFLMEVVDGKMLGVEAVRTFPFQPRDQLTFYDLPNLEIGLQKDIPIGLDSFRLRSALYHQEAAYLFYFRTDDDGTVLMAKTADFGERWDIYRFILSDMSQAVIKTATFEEIGGIVYLRKSENEYYRLIEGNPISLEAANNPNQTELTAHEQVYSLNILSDEDVWVSSESGLFQYQTFAGWRIPSNFKPYPSRQSIAKFQEQYYLLDESQRLYRSMDGNNLNAVRSFSGVEGLKGFDTAIFAFGETLFYSLDGQIWLEISLAGVDSKIIDILALEDELVIASENRRFYFLSNINGNWTEIEVGSGVRGIGFDEATNKLYIYELPISDLDTDISIYEKVGVGDNEWVAQGASLFGQLYPSERFKLLFYQDQILKLDYAEEHFLFSKDRGFSWQTYNPELGQLTDIALTDAYCYLATRSNGVYRADISEIIQTDSITIEEGEIDLALYMTVDKPEFETFDNLVYSITILNSGPDTAKDVSVRFFPEIDVNGLAYVRATTSKGNTRGWDNLWRNIQLAPRERANLKLTYFARINEPLTLFAEVSEAAQNDRDSEPGNFSILLDNEDDEAQVTAYPEEQNSLIHRQTNTFHTSYLSVYPTLANDKVNLETQLPNGEGLQLRILDKRGREIATRPLEAGHYLTVFSTENLAKGTYLVQVIGQRQLLETQLFIKL